LLSLWGHEPDMQCKLKIICIKFIASLQTDKWYMVLQ